MAVSAHLRVKAETVAGLRSSASRVVIIGSSGWLGSAALAMLDLAFPGDEFSDRVLVFGSRERSLVLPSGRQVACHALEALPGSNIADGLVLHFAYLTKDKSAVMSVEDYVDANDAIQDRVIAAVRAGRPRGFFFASSGAVYQYPHPSRPSCDRHLYAWMKATHEAQFAAATGGAGTTFVNGRIFSLSGEFINKADLYALSNILVALRAGGPIRLRAAREVWRSYAYVGDVINLVLALLLKRHSAPCLDIAGSEAIEIGELAGLCAGLCAGPTGHAGVPILRPPFSSDPPDRMVGDSTGYDRLLRDEGMQPLSLSDQIRATATYLDIACDREASTDAESVRE